MAITFASSVREALPVLTLPDEADGLLDDIEQREDPGLAQRATAKLYTLIGDTTSGALGGVLVAIGAGALGIGSWPSLVAHAGRRDAAERRTDRSRTFPNTY